MVKNNPNHQADAIQLNEAAVMEWMAGNEAEAISIVGKSLQVDPHNPFAKINRYYFNASIENRKINKENREKRRVKKLSESNPPSNPEVSVIIPTYNRLEFLEEALASVLAQTMPDFEVIVVNDDGPVEAEDICRKFNDDRVRYALTTHSGVSSGTLNAGLALAKGKYVAYLDDDDLYKPDHLEILLGESKKSEKNTVIYSDAERILGEHTDDGWSWSGPLSFYREDFDLDKLYRANFIHYQCVIHPLEMVMEAGGYNEGINFAVNWELWIRLAAKYPFKRVPKATVIYRDRKTGDTMSTDPKRRRQHSRNVIVYMHRILKMRHSEMKSASRLDRALRNLLDVSPDIIELLDLRKLVAGKPYSMLYELGKLLATAGRNEEARAAFKWAIYLAPWETRSYTRWLSLLRRK